MRESGLFDLLQNHIINNLYTNEISKLVVKNDYMKIKTEKNTSSLTKAIITALDKTVFLIFFWKS